MIPGELHILSGQVELNNGRKKITIKVINKGDRPIQVGSHFHFYEVNIFLKFNRSITMGFRLDIPAGTSVRFEPGQFRNVRLVQYSGNLKIFGFCKAIMGKIK